MPDLLGKAPPMTTTNTPQIPQNTPDIIEAMTHAQSHLDSLAKALEVKVKNDVATSLGELVKLFPKLPASARSTFWSGPPMNQTLEALGLVWRPFSEQAQQDDKAARPRKIKIPTMNVTPERILAALAGGKKLMRKELIAALDTTGTTLDPKLKALVSAGKIDCEEDGTKKLYFATGK